MLQAVSPIYLLRFRRRSASPLANSLHDAATRRCAAAENMLALADEGAWPPLRGGEVLPDDASFRDVLMMGDHQFPRRLQLPTRPTVMAGSAGASLASDAT